MIYAIKELILSTSSEGTSIGLALESLRSESKENICPDYSHNLNNFY